MLWRCRSYSALICFQSTRLRPAGSFGWLSAVGAMSRRIGLSPPRLAKDPESAAGRTGQTAVSTKKTTQRCGEKDNLSSSCRQNFNGNNSGAVVLDYTLHGVPKPTVPVFSVSRTLIKSLASIFPVSLSLATPSREVRRRLRGALDCIRDAIGR